MADCVSGQANKAADNKQQPVKQVQSPVVMTVAPEKQSNGQTDKAKTETDRPRWYAQPEWWLCILGIPTLCYLIRQIHVMQVQAGHMERQTKIQRDSVAVAQRSADAAIDQIEMVKNKERGRLRIEFGHVDLVNDPDPDNGYEVPFKLILDGATQVYIRENSCAAAIRETDEVPADDPWWRGMGLPTTITPEDRTFKGSMTILTEEKPWGEPPFGPDEARVSLVREEKLHVFVRAFVRYDDIFGGVWEIRFNNKWAYNHDFFTFDKADLSGGLWVSIGDNGEYKAQKQSNNPN
jgi:hypothetical protein